MNIRPKITFLICAVVLVFIVFGMFVGYFCIFDSMQNRAGEDYRGMAQLMASSVAEIIDKQTELIKINITDEILKNAVQESNLKYQTDVSAVQNYLMDMDKKWTGAPAGSSLIKEYLDNNPSFILKSVMSEGEKIVNILITDKYGGLVGSTEVTPNFYYGDKDWWREAFDGGKGKVSLGDVVFNERTNTWSVPFAVPIKVDTGEVIGIYRLAVDISLFFGPLENFRIGKTGGVALVDDRGYLIFGPGASPFSGKFCSYEDLQKVLHGKTKWCIIDSVYLHDKGAFIAFAGVDHPLLAGNGMNWQVFVTQDSKETFGILGAFINKMTIFGGGLLIILVFAGFMLGGFFVRPIVKLREGIERIGRGDLDYKVKAETDDEIGRLTDSLTEMADNLKKITVPKADFEAEVAGRKAIEDKIRQLNSDLVSVVSRLRTLVYIAKQEIEAVLKESPAAINEKQRKMVATAESNIDRLSQIIDNLLDVAKIEAGKMELKKAVVDIRGLLKDIVFVFEPRIRGKGLSLKLDIPKEAVNLDIDAGRIRQVFGHLIENAIKFTENGYIALSVKEAKNDVECSLADTGVGIFEENTPKIFDRAGKPGYADDQEGQDVGLGLSVVRGIVEAHNGKIWVESEPGKGTKFIFLLPKHKKP